MSTESEETKNVVDVNPTDTDVKEGSGVETSDENAEGIDGIEELEQKLTNEQKDRVNGAAFMYACAKDKTVRCNGIAQLRAASILLGVALVVAVVLLISSHISSNKLVENMVVEHSQELEALETKSNSELSLVQQELDATELKLKDTQTTVGKLNLQIAEFEAVELQKNNAKFEESLKQLKSTASEYKSGCTSVTYVDLTTKPDDYVDTVITLNLEFKDSNVKYTFDDGKIALTEEITGDKLATILGTSSPVILFDTRSYHRPELDELERCTAYGVFKGMAKLEQVEVTDMFGFERVLDTVEAPVLYIYYTDSDIYEDWADLDASLK